MLVKQFCYLDILFGLSNDTKESCANDREIHMHDWGTRMTALSHTITRIHVQMSGEFMYMTKESSDNIITYYYSDLIH